MVWLYDRLSRSDSEVTADFGRKKSVVTAIIQGLTALQNSFGKFLNRFDANSDHHMNLSLSPLRPAFGGGDSDKPFSIEVVNDDLSETVAKGGNEA